MLTVIEDAGPRLGEIALFLAATAAMLHVIKEYFQRLRSMARAPECPANRVAPG
jgi:hypothetical protein